MIATCKTLCFSLSELRSKTMAKAPLVKLDSHSAPAVIHQYCLLEIELFFRLFSLGRKSR